MTRYVTILESAGKWTVINGPNQTRTDQLLTIKANGTKNPTNSHSIMLCKLTVEKVVRLSRKPADIPSPEPYISKRTKK